LIICFLLSIILLLIKVKFYIKAEQFPIDLKKAFDIGVRLTSI